MNFCAVATIVVVVVVVDVVTHYAVIVTIDVAALHAVAPVVVARRAVSIVVVIVDRRTFAIVVNVGLPCTTAIVVVVITRCAIAIVVIIFVFCCAVAIAPPLPPPSLLPLSSSFFLTMLETLHHTHPLSYVVTCSAVAIIIEVVACHSIAIVLIIVVRGTVATIAVRSIVRTRRSARSHRCHHRRCHRYPIAAILVHLRLLFAIVSVCPPSSSWPCLSPPSRALLTFDL